MATTKYTVTKNGDKLQLSNVITLSGCLQDVAVTLPTIAAANVYYDGEAAIGTYAGDEWVIGDWCEPEDKMYKFEWCVEITDIDNIDGLYEGLGITTTTQDIIDDDFSIEIVKACPEIGTGGPEEDCEVTETIVCYEATPIKKKKAYKNIQIITGERMGSVKRKIVPKTESDECGLDNLKVG